MKGKLYAFGALILAVVSAFLGAFVMRSASDSNKAQQVRDAVDEGKIKMHRKASNEAFKEAKRHIKKAKEITARREQVATDSLDESVLKWNDEKL
tara:strand:+ start:17130 stop:17414 length:285 start_codon:yes stop_codon:yes gene_type:complete